MSPKKIPFLCIATCVSFLVLANSVRAENAEERKADKNVFHDDKFFIDFSVYGSGLSKGRGVSANNADYDFYPYFLIIQKPRSESAQRIIAAQYFNVVPKTDSSSARLGLEYALSEWFSIGASYTSSSYKVHNIRYIETLGTSTQFLLLAFSNESLIETLSLARVSSTISAKTLDTDFRFHVQAGDFDPYIKLSLGSGNTSIRDGFSFGSRFRPMKRVYLFLEAYYESLLLEERAGLDYNLYDFEDRGVRAGLTIPLFSP